MRVRKCSDRSNTVEKIDAHAGRVYFQGLLKPFINKAIEVRVIKTFVVLRLFDFPILKKMFFKTWFINFCRSLPRRWWGWKWRAGSTRWCLRRRSSSTSSRKPSATNFSPWPRPNSTKISEKNSSNGYAWIVSRRYLNTFLVDAKLL